MISERIKAALARSKNRGLRNPIMHSKAFRRQLLACAAAALRKAAMDRAEAYRVHIEWALCQPGLDDKQILFRGARREPQRAADPITNGWPLELDECCRHRGEP